MIGGIGALSAWHPTEAEAIAEIMQYLDEAIKSHRAPSPLGETPT
jgi:hypothetical protein